MYMSDHEILYDYNHAADQAAQVRILAELNAVDVATMRNKLLDLGAKNVPDEKYAPKRLGSTSFDESLAFELHSAGGCDEDMAKALGVCRRTIADWRQRNGLRINRKLPVPREPETESDPEILIQAVEQSFMSVGGLLRAARQIMSAFPQAEVFVGGQRLCDIRVHVAYSSEGEVSSAKMELVLEGN